MQVRPVRKEDKGRYIVATMIVDEGMRNTLAWKCSTEDFMFGTRLVVHESQQAVFFRDGQALEVLGPGMHILETGNFPFLRHFTKLRFGKYFHCEVYFINHAVQMEIPWGTRERVMVNLELEPGQVHPLSIGASGAMNIQVDPDQVTKFLTYLLGTGASLERDDIHRLFGNMMAMNITDQMANVLTEKLYNVFELDKEKRFLGERIRERLVPEFDKYGLILKEFSLANFAKPIDDPVYQHALAIRERRFRLGTDQDLEMQLQRKQAAHDVEMAKIHGQKTLTEAEVQAKSTVLEAQGQAARRSLEGITSIQEHQFDTMNHMIDAGAIAGLAGGGSSSVSSGMGDMTGLMGDMMKFSMGMQMAKEMTGVMKDVMSSGAQVGGQIGNELAATASMAGQPGAVSQPGMMPGITPFGASLEPMMAPVQPEMPAPSQPPVQSEVSAPVEENWICEKCGKENSAENGFCGGCGQKKPEPKPVEEDWICPGCGKKNPADNGFCGGCGQKKPAPAPKDWFCGKCGRKNPADNGFCGGCGHPKGGN